MISGLALLSLASTSPAPTVFIVFLLFANYRLKNNE